MIKIVILCTIACILFPSVEFLSAYGDGLASETLPPSMIGSKNVTLSINTSPFLIDNYHAGTQINFVLLDVSNQQPIPQATIAVSVFKGDSAILGHVFMSDSGNFLLDLMPDSSINKISIDEQGRINLSMLTGEETQARAANVRPEGPERRGPIDRHDAPRVQSEHPLAMQFRRERGSGDWRNKRPGARPAFSRDRKPRY